MPHPPIRDENGWMPIESALKTEFILLHCGEDDSIWFAKWQGDVWHGVDELGMTREGHSAGDPDYVTGWFVEHWQPLPAGPVASITPPDLYSEDLW